MMDFAQKKKLALLLSEPGYWQILDLARRLSQSFSQLLRLSLSLLKTVIDETDRGHLIVVCAADGRPLKELVLPCPKKKHG